MKKTVPDTRYMATLAMLCGLLLVMGMTGIGFIPIPVIKSTTMHIPVILGAILLGPAAGAVLGGVFGLCSIWVNTTAPGLLSFAFSPFMTVEGLPGVLKSIWIAFFCRVIFGYAAGWLWVLMKKLFKKDYLALPVTAAVSSLFHSVIVMASIYVLLAEQYAAAKNVAVTAVFGLVMGTITTASIPEAVIAAILVTVIGKALIHLTARMNQR